MDDWPLLASPWLWCLLGLLFGSLATALSYRLPLGLPVALDRSRCPRCGTVLGAFDLVPVFSWLMNRGRCRHCREAIGWRYPLIEIMTAALFLLAGLWSEGDLVGTALLAATAFGLVVITVADLEHGVIPDAMLLFLVPVAVIARFWSGGDWLDGALGAIIGLGLPLLVRVGFRRWRGRDGLGLGDVKFLGMAGLYVGLSGFGAFLVVSGLLGLLLGLGWRLTGRGPVFPLGPALAATLLFAAFEPSVLPGLLAR